MASTPHFLGLCVIFRDNADTLPALLESIKSHFDVYSFTDTGSKDGSRDLVEGFLKDNPGQVTDFTWVDDFAKARNCCFDACPARWKFFLDSDDVLINGEKLRPLLTKLESQHPEVEGVFFPYLYGHLEELQTMRMCRWRDGWKWNDAIHERLEFHYPDGEGLPEAAFARFNEVVVKHKDKTPEEKERALRRNADIARKEWDGADEKYRARLGRTLAMEAKMDGRAADTLPLLKPLYQHYRSFPEGRQAAADIAKANLHLQNLDEALVWAKKAGPAYEALVHWERNEYEATLKAVQRSAGMGPQTTHEGLIFEQGACYVAAAGAALELGMDPAVAERLVSYIPPEVRNDPTIISHVNIIRGDIDRVTILVPGTPQPFDENGGGGMLGGSEEAVMYLTRALAEQGRNVRVFGVLPPHRLPGKDKYGVDWQDASSFNPDDECGTVVLWRAPQVLLNLMQKAAAQGRPFGGVLQAYLWLHDSGFPVPPQGLKPVSDGVAGAIVLSDFHGRMIRRAGYTGKLFLLSNGVVEEDFEPEIDEPTFGFRCVDDKCPQCTGPGDIYPNGCGQQDWQGPAQVFRDPNSVVYSSCPSRGLVPLLRMWPAVKAECPDARLDIYYDWSMLEQMQPHKFEEVSKAYEAVKHLDVIHHGGVDHPTLNAALRRANVWAYSHFESPDVETFCISAVKATAAGATVLTVPNGALPEVAPDAHFVKSVEDYQVALIGYLKYPHCADLRRVRARSALERYGWRKVAEKFGKVWTVRKAIQNGSGTEA